MFRVLGTSSGLQRSENRHGSFVVTDEPAEYNCEAIWPVCAEFKVSMRHDELTQLRRAHEYADYLNKGIVIQPPIGD